LPKIVAGASPAFDFTISTVGAKTSSGPPKESARKFAEKPVETL
jgi:hypothetical protein